MSYQIYPLKENLVFITWFQRPHIRSAVEQKFTNELSQLLEDASEPVYFISDLRRGFIRNPVALRSLAKTFNHPNFAGAAAFSNDVIVGIDYSIYLVSSRRYTYTRHREAPQLYSHAESALAYLESKSPNLTRDIDWQALLHVTV